MPPHVTSAAFVNRPDVRRACLPGGGGIMNARAVARHYALLASYGMLDGVRLLAPERIDMMRAPQGDGIGLGYQLAGDPAKGGVLAMGRSGGAFGHAGNGGSLGFANPARKLGFGLTKNLMKAVDDPAQASAYRVAEAIRQHLDAG